MTHELAALTIKLQTFSRQYLNEIETSWHISVSFTTINGNLAFDHALSQINAIRKARSISVKFILILSSHLHLDLAICQVPQDLPTKSCMQLSSPSCMLYARLSYPSCYNSLMTDTPFDLIKAIYLHTAQWYVTSTACDNICQTVRTGWLHTNLNVQTTTMIRQEEWHTCMKDNRNWYSNTRIYQNWQVGNTRVLPLLKPFVSHYTDW
jgi:hypothetical protein